MAVSDPIADFLTRIRNGVMAQRRYVDVSWSRLKQHLAEILKENGFIDDVLVKNETPQRGTIRIFLKYDMRRAPAIRGIKRESKPGLRRYVTHDKIPYFYGGLGLSILSTSQGILPGQEATKRKIGGELLCTVW